MIKYLIGRTASNVICRVYAKRINVQIAQNARIVIQQIAVRARVDGGRTDRDQSPTGRPGWTGSPRRAD